MIRSLRVWSILVPALFVSPAHATYQANCGVSGSSPVSNASVISAFAEPRPVDSMTPTNVRWHSGVDIGQCNAGKKVYPILAGTREAPTVCTGATCLRIRDSANHAFDYEHLDLTVNPSLPAIGQKKQTVRHEAVTCLEQFWSGVR